MGSKKKDRAKARKAGKAALASLKEAVAKANACTPAEATALLQQTAANIDSSSSSSSSPLAMTLLPPPTTTTTIDAAPASSSAAPVRLRFEYHTPASLPKAWREPLFQIFKGNMQAEYERNWGYKEAEKRAEIFAPDARYLVAIEEAEEEKEASPSAPPPQSPPASDTSAEGKEGKGTGGGGGGTPLGFLHLRYVLDEEDEAASEAAVLYIYEIQLAPALQRRGVGQRLMALSEALGAALGLRKMKLTVFRTNAAALAFYRAKLGYAVDASSPSQWKVEECYEILSKPLLPLPPVGGAGVAGGQGQQ